MTNAPRTTGRRSIRRHQLVGLAVVGLLVGVVGSWAATTSISGAVIAPGTLVVDTNVKKVQHPTGGIVGEILARDGDHVTAGQVVLRLDDTMTRASLAIVTKGLTEFYARKARLEAERDGADAIVIPDELAARSNEKDVAHVVNGAQRLFELRKSARVGQKERLQQRVEQLNQEIVGLEAQAKAKSKEIKLIKTELSGARRLWAKNLIPIRR